MSQPFLKTGNLSFRIKLIFSFIALSMVPLLIMSFLAYRLSYDIISENTAANAEMIIDRVQDELNELFDKTLQVADSIAENAIIQQALQANFNPEDEQFSLNAKAGEELLEIFKYREELYGIAVIGENGQSLISTGRATRQEDFRGRYWYRQVLQSAFTPHYYPPHTGSYVFNEDETSFFTLAIPVEDRLSSARLGIVIIEIEEELLKKLIRLRLEERGYLFIQYGRAGFTSTAAQVPDSEYLVRLANKKPIDPDLLEQKREIVLIRELNLDEVRLASVVSLAALAMDSRKIGIVLILLLLASLVVSIITAALLSLSIARPVQRMRGLMLSVEEGDLSGRMTYLRSDELGDLGRSFNRMVERISTLVENIKEDQIQLRKAELRTLQEQINPHFLYNTLDSINWLSREGRNEEIPAMITGLTNLFRISLSRGRDIITFREEMSHAEAYLTIQKIRYENRLRYEIDLDESASSCLILKLIIQPLIENALYHGIKEKKGMGLISIRARKVRTFLIVEVEDNGLGMTEERLTEVRKALASGNKEERKTLYGIKNVHDRLKIYYGEPYGLTIHSIQGEGTTVTLKIPVVEEE